jgi:hypothetical protein
MRAIVLLIATLAAPIYTQTPAPHQLKGTIRDSQGAVISGAYILIRWDPSGKAHYQCRDRS